MHSLTGLSATHHALSHWTLCHAPCTLSLDSLPRTMHSLTGLYATHHALFHWTLSALLEQIDLHAGRNSANNKSFVNSAIKELNEGL
jgi:hypothetical protein